MEFPKYFSLYEFLNSATAREHNIELRPSFQVVENLRLLAVNVLDPIRMNIQMPMKITSGYRNVQLNQLVGGVSGSQHLLGEAADFTISDILKLSEIYYKIKKSTTLPYWQCIYYPRKFIIHISYKAGLPPRRQSFIKQ